MMPSTSSSAVGRILTAEPIFFLDRCQGFEGVLGKAIVALPFGQGYASHQASAGKLGFQTVVVLGAHYDELAVSVLCDCYRTGGRLHQFGEARGVAHIVHGDANGQGRLASFRILILVIVGAAFHNSRRYVDFRECAEFVRLPRS